MQVKARRIKEIIKQIDERKNKLLRNMIHWSNNVNKKETKTPF